MNTLTALPISGESFLLRRPSGNVLVDGGYDSEKLAAALERYAPDVKHLDVVVCTHGDMDHAGGLAQLIDASGIGVGEFWLPGKWADSVEELLTDTRALIDGLLAELDALEEDEKHIETDGDPDQASEAIERRLVGQRSNVESEGSEEPDQATAEATNKEDSPWFNVLRRRVESIEAEDNEARGAFRSGRRRVQYRIAQNIVSAGIGHYWLGLIDTAETIREIARQAIVHNVRVRWFDFDAFVRLGRAKGGKAGVLEPVNSVELAQPPKILGMTYIARLSARNEECLSFFAPTEPKTNGLGVLFSGDSPLGGGPRYMHSFLATAKPPSSPIIATAPHHGSENNAVAYNHVHNWAEVALWIRTGGSTRHPGATYKSLEPGYRCCTHCPQSNFSYGKVEVALQPNVTWWPVAVIPHFCGCA